MFFNKNIKYAKKIVFTLISIYLALSLVSIDLVASQNISLKILGFACVVGYQQQNSPCNN